VPDVHWGALDTYEYSEPAAKDRLAHVMTYSRMPRRQHGLVEAGIVYNRVIGRNRDPRFLGFLAGA